MLAEIYLEKARVLAERGETQAPALRQYQAWIRNALEHDPSLAAGWRCVLAGALFRLEQVVDDDAGANDAIAEAESALREARRIDPTHPELLRSTARLRLYMARSASAQRRSQLLQDGLAQLNPLIDRDVPDARALLVAAHLLLAQGGDSHRTDASVLLQRAISINPLLATEASTLQGKCSN